MLVRAGTVFYAVAYASTTAQFGPWEVGYASAAPSPSDTIAAVPASFQGAFAAAGNFSVQGGSVLSVALQPPCFSDELCAKSLHALAAGTQYWVSTVLVCQALGCLRTSACAQVLTPCWATSGQLCNVRSSGVQLS